MNVNDVVHVLKEEMLDNQHKSAAMLEHHHRENPLGASAIDGNSLYFIDGTELDLAEFFRDKGFCENNRLGYGLVKDLVHEIILYRAMFTEFMRRDGSSRITDANEFNRGISSLAGKIRTNPDHIRSLVTPLIKKLVDDMLTPRPQKTEDKKHGKNRQN